METTTLEYLVVSCKIGSWNKTDEKPMKLEHDKLEKTKGLNLVFVVRIIKNAVMGDMHIYFFAKIHTFYASS